MFLTNLVIIITFASLQCTCIGHDISTRSSSASHTISLDSAASGIAEIGQALRSMVTSTSTDDNYSTGDDFYGIDDFYKQDDNDDTDPVEDADVYSDNNGDDNDLDDLDDFYRQEPATNDNKADLTFILIGSFTAAISLLLLVTLVWYAKCLKGFKRNERINTSVPKDASLI